MSATRLLLPLLLAACAAPGPHGPPHPEDHGERVTFLLGGRSLEDDGFWEPLDDPIVYGCEFESVGLGFLDLEMSLLASHERAEILGSDHRLRTLEFGFGGRKTFAIGGVRPYVGAGLAVLRARLDIDAGTYDEVDETIGSYVHCGLYVPLGQRSSLGLDYRVLGGTEVDLPGFAGSDMDYSQLAITFGFSF